MEQEILKPVPPLSGKHKATVAQFDERSGECIRIDNFMDARHAEKFYQRCRYMSGRIVRLVVYGENTL